MSCFGMLISLLITGLTLMSPPIVSAASEPAGTPTAGNVEIQQPNAPPTNAADRKAEPLLQSVETLVYKPPLRGAPARTVAGGTRGIGQEALKLYVLAPDHVGLTIQEQPALYWYLSGPSRYPLEFTIIEAGAIRPLLETRLTPTAPAGVQIIRLADHGVRLKRSGQYQWFVAIVQDPEQRSKDIIASAEIERVEPSGSLTAELKRVGKTGAASVYAEEGIWYDALMAVSDLIVSAPEQSVYLEQRASLLRQVGLKEVAEHQ
jgi:hypothetical protein